jgi:hypothetical protein
MFLTHFQELAGHNNHSALQAENSWIGLVWLAFSLFCDGFIGPKQEALKKHYHPSEHELMLGTNFCGALILLPGLPTFKFKFRFESRHMTLCSFCVDLRVWSISDRVPKFRTDGGRVR